MNIHYRERDRNVESLYLQWNEMFKDKRIAICIPTYDMKIRMETMMSLFFMWKPDFFLSYKCSPCIDVNRNVLVERALKDKKVTHVLFVDTDNVMPPNLLSRFLQHDLPVMTGIYYQRKIPFRCTQFIGVSEGRFKALRLADYEEGSLVQIHATGAGALLIKREVFDQLERPYFKFMNREDGLKITGEDIYFCQKLMEADIPIYVDTSILSQHIGDELVVPQVFEEGYLEITEKTREMSKGL